MHQWVIRRNKIRVTVLGESSKLSGCCWLALALGTALAWENLSPTLPFDSVDRVFIADASTKGMPFSHLPIMTDHVVRE